MKLKTFVFQICLILGIAGCDNGGRNVLWDQLDQLGKEKTDLKLQVQQLEEENKGLTEQIDTISNIDKNTRLSAMPELSRLEIGKRTGIFDKNNDGKLESLIVYIRPIDTSGDPVKTPGSCHIQLWDLNSAPADALLSEWQVEPTVLKDLWAGTIMTDYFRLTFDISDLLTTPRKELTVKVTFVDYVRGKVFREQKVIQQ